MTMQWRVSLDVPYTHCIERGFECDRLKHQFVADQKAFSDTILEPVTGLVMLKPSVLKEDWHTNVIPLSDFNITSYDGFWQESKRSADLVSMYAMVRPQSQVANNIGLTNLASQVAITAYLENIVNKDTLVWAMESKNPLSEDESFSFHYNGITDQMLRKNNWFAIQWDNIYILFGHQGRVRVYRWEDRAHMDGAPDLMHEFYMGDATELVGKDGYLWFLPIPGQGLLMHHTQTAQRANTLMTSASKTTVRGHLIPWPTREIDGKKRLFEMSPIRFAVNQYQKGVFAFARVRFASSGTYVDAPFDPGRKPSTSPTVSAEIINTGHGAASASVRKADDSGAWAVGDRQGRIKVALSTTDTIYTPFMSSCGVRWQSQFATRGTTPVAPRLLALEYTIDKYGRAEGTCEFLMESVAERKIADRGDTTVLVENSSDGVTWATVFGGIACDCENEAFCVEGQYFWYRSKWGIHGIHHRFEEVHVINELAFDTLSIRQAIDNTLNQSGFPPLRNYPARAEQITLPGLAGQEKQWKYAPTWGAGGWDTIQKLCYHLTRAGEEYFIQYDYAAEVFDLVQRSRLTTALETWHLTPFVSEHDLANRIARYSSARWKPDPPVANELYVVGLLPESAPPNIYDVGINQTHGEARKMTGFAANTDSLTDTTSADYLGRVKVEAWAIEEAAIKGQVNRFARMVFDRIGHRRLQGTVEVPDYNAYLGPNRYVEVWDDAQAAIGGAPIWIVEGTVKVREGMDAMMILKVDSQWEHDFTT